MSAKGNVTQSVSMLAVVLAAACSASTGAGGGKGNTDDPEGGDVGAPASTGDGSTSGVASSVAAICDTMACGDITAGVTGALTTKLSPGPVEACGLCEFNLLARDCATYTDAAVPALSTSSTSVGPGTCFLELLFDCQRTTETFAGSVADLTTPTLSQLCSQATNGCFWTAVTLDAISGSYECAPYAGSSGGTGSTLDAGGSTDGQADSD
jgi:hypothetical protein